jgi:SET domain-containing protein
MFAVRDIIKGEQLTFDYRQGRQIGIEDTESEEDGDGEGEETMECKCGSSRCRKILFL